ncbi:sulfotransferase family protein [Epibacterium ulvae]|uniref:sulfotransferase family 2 domain-containing protein n=1 Tax=Epibacterium ulvae TaxID=1156985 RepID=UPI001BFC4A3D|nr:sulfotransferase family 2 domain-containing protein [Epibacterium ulvae]MBT8152409.1 sulfotransferase family protein [Epibacterium ulvae]
MLVFLKENLVFLSVPKTGTTAYMEALAPRADMVVANPPELKHAPVYRYNRWFRPMFAKICSAEPELLAVVREPISWLGSWYKFRQRPYLDGKPTSTKGICFDDFVREYCRGKPAAFANIGSQVKFLEPQPNGCKVTHVFRYEELDKLDAFLNARLGVNIQTPKANVSASIPLQLSSQTEEILRRKKADEFALYDGIPQGEA